MSFAAAEADRRIANTAQIGTIVSVDAAGARATVRLGGIETADIPVGQLRAGALSFWWMPAIGEQVLVISPSGDLAQGVIVASIFAGNAPSADAATPMIDLDGGTLKVNGSIELTGDVIADGDVTAGPSPVSLLDHVHIDVTPGTAKSGEPDQ